MVEALQHKGFSFVEVVAPCPVYYGRRNRLGEAVDELRYYKENTIVRNSADLEDLDLVLSGKIVVGKFVDKERPTLADMMRDQVNPRAQAALARR
jgi:2-oxoglutarate ferredoxin oxidoreductase subunit beta